MSAMTKLYQMYPEFARPCNITTDDKLWAVVGVSKDMDEGGVLVWCYDIFDAYAVLDKVKDTNLFIGLKAEPYVR